MTKPTPSSPTAQVQPEVKPQAKDITLPNPNIKAPKNVLVTEGYAPPKRLKAEK